MSTFLSILNWSMRESEFQSVWVCCCLVSARECGANQNDVTPSGPITLTYLNNQGCRYPGHPNLDASLCSHFNCAMWWFPATIGCYRSSRLEGRGWTARSWNASNEPPGVWHWRLVMQVYGRFWKRFSTPDYDWPILSQKYSIDIWKDVRFYRCRSGLFGNFIVDSGYNAWYQIVLYLLYTLRAFAYEHLYRTFSHIPWHTNFIPNVHLFTYFRLVYFWNTNFTS